MGHAEIGSAVEAINADLLDIEFLDVHASMMGKIHASCSSVTNGISLSLSTSISRHAEYSTYRLAAGQPPAW